MSVLDRWAYCRWYPFSVRGPVYKAMVVASVVNTEIYFVVDHKYERSHFSSFLDTRASFDRPMYSVGIHLDF